MQDTPTGPSQTPPDSIGAAAPPGAPHTEASPTTLPTSVGEAVDQTVQTVTNWTNDAMRLAEAYGPRVLGALIVLILAWIVAVWARRMVVKGLVKAKVDLTLAKFFGNLAKWGILFAAVVASLGTFGINTTSFAAVIGAAGLAVGLALQGNLSNLAAGVLLLIFRPFKIGDAVVVAGQAGVIDGIDLFTTNLDTVDNRRIIIPNGAIFGGVIENQSYHPRRAATVTVTIAASTPIDHAVRVLTGATERVLAGVPGALRDPAPAVLLMESAPATIYAVTMWAETPKFAGLRPALLREIKLAVDAAQIGPTAPIQKIEVVALPASR